MKDLTMIELQERAGIFVGWINDRIEERGRVVEKLKGEPKECKMATEGLIALYDYKRGALAMAKELGVSFD